MLFLVLQELDLLFPLFLLNISPLFVALINGFDLGLEFFDLVVKLGLPFFQLNNPLLQLSLALLSLQLFAHTECDSTLVQSLISGDGHLDLITYSQQQQSSFRFVDGHLSDDLVEAL